MILGSGVFCTVCVLALVSSAAAQEARPLVCDPVPTGLFTPRHPEIGQYEVCTTPQPLTVLSRADPTIGAPENVEPLDAFGSAGSYDRPALARLYGGTPAQVAHGWMQEGGRFQSVTLISPFPDATLTRLLPGTLIIRFTLKLGT